MIYDHSVGVDCPVTATGAGDKVGYLKRVIVVVGRPHTGGITTQRDGRRRRVNRQRRALRGRIARASGLNIVSAGIGRLHVADGEGAGAAAADDRDASAQVAVIEHGRSLLPDKAERASSRRVGGEAGRATQAYALISRIAGTRVL